MEDRLRGVLKQDYTQTRLDNSLIARWPAMLLTRRGSTAERASLFNTT